MILREYIDIPIIVYSIYIYPVRWCPIIYCVGVGVNVVVDVGGVGVGVFMSSNCKVQMYVCPLYCIFFRKKCASA